MHFRVSTAFVARRFPFTAAALTTAVLVGAVALVAAGAASAHASEVPNRPLLRFPDIHGDLVVFVHGEDIWSAPAEGGVARRLTLHDGEERYPKFSPDGRWIAFTGDYDGNADVYVMSAEGGDIRRVTFHPDDDVVVGWHPTKGKILFQSGRRAYSRFTRLYLIAPDGTGLEELVLHEAAWGSFSPDGSKIVYNRVAREHRTWKRYQGGLAQDLWLFDFGTNEDRKLTSFEGTDRAPMWIGDTIYFSSDRDRVLNLYALDPESGETRQLTRHTEFDVRRPSDGSGRIVYELGGEIWSLDTKSGETRRIPIEVLTDQPERRPYRKDVSEDVTQVTCSPTGQRALVIARGDVFTVPRKEGPTRNLTESSGSREKDAVWSPDGKRIAYLSDESGEYGIHLIDPLGKEPAVRLTTHESGYRHTLRWSPDSKRIAFADQTLRFYWVDVESGKIHEVDRSATEPTDIGIDLKPIHDYAWSPDSRYLAYSKIDADLVSRVYLHSLETGETRRVSGDLFNDFGPVFSRDGRHLLFISNRRFDPTFCDFEWEMVYKKAAGIYALTLRKGGEPLLPLRSDEEDGAGATKEGAEAAKAEAPRVVVDFDGIEGRVEALPLPPGNYRRLAANDSRLFYLDADAGDFNRFEFRAVEAMDLHAFTFEDRKSRTVIDGIAAYDLSADGSWIAYQKGDTVGIVAAGAEDSKGEPLDLSGLVTLLNPVAEWRQIFEESWRMERDFYYEPNLHGIDWAAMRQKYGRLVPSASCRQDLQYIVGELIGELNTSHTYVYGGDRKRRAERVDVGMLGADWDVDAENGRFRLAKIYRVPDFTLGVWPPLARPGIDVKEGDYLLEVDGVDVRTDRSLYAYFQGLAGKRIAVVFNDRPARAGAREFLVEPIGSERVLRYRDWLEHNREIVERESNGQIGYLHLPDTYLGSTREFPKYFYGQTRKKGLLVDGRFNGGGLDPDIFLQRLAKTPLSWWTRRYSFPQTSPPVTTTAHMVLLTNRQAGSGGDMLPDEFRRLGLGPVIGTRTWGGLVGVSMFLTMVDGGRLTAPDYRIWVPGEGWIIENEGVVPDIEVDLTPAEMARGFDAQLMKGVEVLLEKIREEPRDRPEPPPFPVDR